MSERNGEKSRFQINRKRAVLRRLRMRELAAVGAGAEKRLAHAKPRQKPRPRADQRLKTKD